MTPSSTCPSCGTALTKDRSGKICPACLLRAALLADPVPESLVAAPREALGTMIGRYKLLEEIGEGGFGIVYMAEQTEPVKRRVGMQVIGRAWEEALLLRIALCAEKCVERLPPKRHFSIC